MSVWHPHLEFLKRLSHHVNWKRYRDFGLWKCHYVSTNLKHRKRYPEVWFTRSTERGMLMWQSGTLVRCGWDDYEEDAGILLDLEGETEVVRYTVQTPDDSVDTEATIEYGIMGGIDGLVMPKTCSKSDTLIDSNMMAAGLEHVLQYKVMLSLRYPCNDFSFCLRLIWRYMILPLELEWTRHVLPFMRWTRHVLPLMRRELTYHEIARNMGDVPMFCTEHESCKFLNVTLTAAITYARAREEADNILLEFENGECPGPYLFRNLSDGVTDSLPDAYTVLLTYALRHGMGDIATILSRLYAEWANQYDYYPPCGNTLPPTILD